MEVEILKEARAVKKRACSRRHGTVERTVRNEGRSRHTPGRQVKADRAGERGRQVVAGRPYRKAGDEPLWAPSRRLIDERPTYGYRRMTRLVNRRQKAEGKFNMDARGCRGSCRPTN